MRLDWKLSIRRPAATMTPTGPSPSPTEPSPEATVPTVTFDDTGRR
jgi:hypothetical protein